MANKYKMAMAFGKAMAQPDNPKMMDKISKGRIYSKKPENQAFRKAWDDQYKYLETNENLPLREKIPDDDAEIALQKDFDEAFDEALSKRVKRQSDAEGRTNATDVRELDDSLRKEAIEMLKDPNNSITDVLDVLNRYND